MPTRLIGVMLFAGWLVSCTRIASARAERPDDDGDLVSFAPAKSTAAQLGRQVALRFDLARRFELALQINNAFTAQNRRAIASAEAAIGAIPGVRKVIGPAGLLSISVDDAGHAVAGPLLAGGADDAASEAVRQRVIRRSDAVGWFLSRDGTQIRLLVDTDDLPRIGGTIEAAVASSGLVLLSGGAVATPLWPEPDRDPRPFPTWLPFAVVGLALFPFVLIVAFFCRPTFTRALIVAIAAGTAAAAPAMLAPVVRIRHAALGVAGGAAMLTWVLPVLMRSLRSIRMGRPSRSVRVKVPMTILLSSLVLVAAAVAAAPRLAVGTQLWRETSLFFVDVRGDLDQPVVLREVRRLTDFLRAEPGVSHAWSIADLFFSVPLAGDDVGGIPDAPEIIHAILARGRDDSAVRLELAPDHREALVGVRFDDESGVDRLTVLDHLERYLLQEHRSALLKVDTSDAGVPPTTRALGRGILAADASRRVLRICARSGRNLSEAEIDSIDRATRRAALLPRVDPGKLKAEIGQEVSGFLETVAISESHVALPRPPDRQRLADVLFAEPADATSADVLGPLRVLWGRRLREPVLRMRAVELQRRLATVRRAHSAHINFNDVLYGADLPTEGVLSEEVRDATREAMGPIVGIPVAHDAPAAVFADAWAVGGAACDRALSAAWLPRVGLGILIAAAAIALLLWGQGGRAAFAWWPAAFALAAPLVLVPAVAALPVGVLYLCVVSGVLSGGVAFAVAVAPGRRHR